MDKELTIIAEPEELIAWADTFDILLNPSIEDAAILLNYMEGHDYAIAEKDVLLRCLPNGVVERTSRKSAAKSVLHTHLPTLREAV